jgi:Methyltransferase domain
MGSQKHTIGLDLADSDMRRSTSKAPNLDDTPPPPNWGSLELMYPHRLVAPPAWVAHIPFAFWIVEAMRPDTIVELGVHSGNSYSSFLQAVQTLSLPTRCFGIDHWRGDEHAGSYGDEVYNNLRAYHDLHYGTFSTLIRSSFHDALHCFSDGTIDLLHIDGLHTYDAVHEDFTNWLPKMSARGVVLLHDIYVREGRFGVWKLWEELASRYPRFEFVHASGLGIVYVGSEPLPDPLRVLFTGTRNSAARIRAYYARLGISVLDRYALGDKEVELSKVRAALTGMKGTAAEAAARVQHLELQLVQMNTAHQSEIAKIITVQQAEMAAALADKKKAEGKILELQQELTAMEGRVVEAASQRDSVGRILRQQTATIGRLQRQLLSAQKPLTSEHDLARLLLVRIHPGLARFIPRRVKKYINASS